MTVILGISNTHNGSVAIIRDGEVVSAIQAERISRRKRQSIILGKENELTKECVSYCLNASGLQYSDIDSIAISTPWNVSKMHDSDLFKYIGGKPKNYMGTFYVPHHFSHMEYIVHFGAMAPGIVLVIDGSGSLEEDRTLFNIDEQHHPDIIDYVHFAGKEVISAYWFDGAKSSLIYRFSPATAPIEESNADANGLLQSIGHYWEWASQYCCGSRNEAGKVMGLAAFGSQSKHNKEKILSINNNGKIKVDYQKIKSTLKEPNVLKLDLSNSIHHQNTALQVQLETESVILKLLKMLREKHPSDTLYLSGGVALNVVANERIINSNLFENVVLNGSVEDNGSAIGAGLAAHSQLGFEKKTSAVTDYYGCSYSQEQIIDAVLKYNFPHQILTGKQTVKFAADLISKNKIFGWFQGRSEFGPRALGNRSILANPADPATKYILDHYMKCRDRYRPYAPVVIEERADQYFDMSSSSPVMMRNVKVLQNLMPAITHCDGTARVQTVNKNDNSILYHLLLEVEKTIGYPVLLNTSFNLPGEPIVESPSDALSCFSRGSLDYLFLGNVLVRRS